MEKEKKAAAIGYSEKERVPQILAQARGFLAEKLIQIAQENNITIYRDADLTEAISLLPAGSEIPETLFRAMAEVLAYCYRINTRFREKFSTSIG